MSHSVKTKSKVINFQTLSRNIYTFVQKCMCKDGLCQGYSIEEEPSLNGVLRPSFSVSRRVSCYSSLTTAIFSLVNAEFSKGSEDSLKYTKFIIHRSDKQLAFTNAGVGSS